MYTGCAARALLAARNTSAPANNCKSHTTPFCNALLHMTWSRKVLWGGSSVCLLCWVQLGLTQSGFATLLAGRTHVEDRVVT